MATAGRRMGGTTARARDGEDGQTLEQVTEQVTEQDEGRRLALERLRRAAAVGDYDGLLDPALWRLLDAAALTVGFGREIGALRFAMARLLAEEQDPRQLSLHLSRITTTIVGATQARPPAAPAEDPVRAALLATIGELDEPSDQAGDAGEPDDDEETGLDEEDEAWRA